MNDPISGIAIFGVIGLLVFIPLILGGLIVLQVFLSRRDNGTLGLILPISLFGFSCLIFLGRLLYPESWYNISVLLVGLVVFIPIAILFVVHLVCRCSKTSKNSNNLDRMRIQDLD